MAAAVLMLVAPFAAHAQQERAVPQTRTEQLLSFSPVVKRAQPAVVNVYASRTDPKPNNPLFDDPIFRRFFGDNAAMGVIEFVDRDVDARGQDSGPAQGEEEAAA